MNARMTQQQEDYILGRAGRALRSLGLSEEQSDRVLNNEEALQSGLLQLFRKLSHDGGPFGPEISEFQLTVPPDYDHTTQIDRFAGRVHESADIMFFEKNLTSKNFQDASIKLMPGKTYAVKIYPVFAPKEQAVSSRDCLGFLRKQGAILTGVQGLTLVYDLKRDELPPEMWTLSFDEETALWSEPSSSGNYARVPGIRRYLKESSADRWEFPLGSFKNSWHRGDCLLAFLE